MQRALPRSAHLLPRRLAGTSTECAPESLTIYRLELHWQHPFVLAARHTGCSETLPLSVDDIRNLSRKIDGSCYTLTRKRHMHESYERGHSAGRSRTGHSEAMGGLVNFARFHDTPFEGHRLWDD